MSTATPTPELPVFDLRCRDAEWIDHPATLDEFAAPAPLADPYAGVAELLIADMVARAQTELGELLAGRVLLSASQCFSLRRGCGRGSEENLRISLRGLGGGADREGAEGIRRLAAARRDENSARNGGDLIRAIRGGRSPRR